MPPTWACTPVTSCFPKACWILSPCGSAPPPPEMPCAAAWWTPSVPSPPARWTGVSGLSIATCAS
ncbi:MAG: hypothetical protein CVU56_10960 [Deltaproteobacteria bacterium HGW-Deltaproteobacteria-14]|nr:MAG: hypothetical protein CVU56_10960 [Deltaproteobacteria bacterium HGW-Deltaproteobacteria-14]